MVVLGARGSEGRHNRDNGFVIFVNIKWILYSGLCLFVLVIQCIREIQLLGDPTQLDIPS